MLSKQIPRKKRDTSKKGLGRTKCETSAEAVPLAKKGLLS